MRSKQLIGTIFDFAESDKVFFRGKGGSTGIVHLQIHHRIFTSNRTYHANDRME